MFCRIRTRASSSGAHFQITKFHPAKTKHPNGLLLLTTTTTRVRIPPHWNHHSFATTIHTRTNTTLQLPTNHSVPAANHAAAQRITDASLTLKTKTILMILAASPVVAAAQAAYFLIHFRRNHKDAPHPVSPSRGIVVARNDETLVSVEKRDCDDGGDAAKPLESNGSSSQELESASVEMTLDKSDSKEGTGGRWWHRFGTTFSKGGGARTTAHVHSSEEEKERTMKPLSLLVIGDSLAAGVGSSSGTPMLPESIARSLSKALNGRPVFWTCHGTPGAATSRIFKDLKEMPHKMVHEIFEGHHHHLHQNHGEQTRDDDEKKSRTIGGGISKQLVRMGLFLDETEVRWIRMVRKRIRELFDRDKFTSPSTTTGAVAMAKDDEDACATKRMNGNISSSSPQIQVGQYDVVVVLTGINDLKSIFLPFLQDEEGTNKLHFKDELKRLIAVLRQKMNLPLIRRVADDVDESDKNDDDHHDDSNRTQAHAVQPRAIRNKDKQPVNDSNHLESRPLVVIPAIPTRMAPLLQYPPLCWALYALSEMIDAQKRALAKEYPVDILFVEAPSVQKISEIERQSSDLSSRGGEKGGESSSSDDEEFDFARRSMRKGERVFLNIRDITDQARAKVEHLISKHVEIHKFDDVDREIELHYEASRHDNVANSMFPDQVGSKLVSFDRVHPNDNGYEFWGRQIADAIIQEWK